MLTAQMGGEPGPSGPWASTLSETAKRRRRPSTMMELGTIRMVGLLRILRAYWSRTTPRPCGARPASTSWTGEGPSEGATMAPGDLQGVVAAGGVSLDLKNRTAMRHSSPAPDLARRPPLPAICRALPDPRYPTPADGQPLARAPGRAGLRRWVPCALTSSSGEEPWSTAPGSRHGAPTSPSPAAASATSATGLAGRPRARCVRPGRQPRLHRHPHPLRRPGVLGPGPDAVVLPRRDDGRRRQLRLLHRAHPPRRRRRCWRARSSTWRT